ncbi:MAG TPA: LysR family transcriptional regulator [Vicinamibacterales bacterium]|nr:LysR family transcriptional regulator [Vicinamibacterales bacterium]
MDIDIRHLRMVTAIAASGSVTRAGRELRLTQSAVSHQLRGIEERLGTPLFLRLGKRMVVTAAGERVLALAGRVLRDLEATEADVRRHGAGQTGVIRVCAQCNTGYHWLPPLVEMFRRRHPAVEVSLAVECTVRPVEALLDGRLDVAIVTEAVRHARVRTRPLFEDEHAVVVAPGHPLARRAFVRPEDLADERLLLYASSPDDSFTIQKILRPAGVVPRRVSFVMLTEAILAMVKARLGVSVMQTWAIEPALRARDVRAVPITPAGIRRQWSAATRREAGEVAHVEAFIDLLAVRALPARRRPLAVRPRLRAAATGRR